MSERDTIYRVAVIGVGIQGSMIAFRNALYGKAVTGYSRTAASVETCRAKIEKWTRHYVETGRITPAEGEALRGRIRYAASLEEACRDADLVVENVPEKLPLKREIFAELDRLCPSETLLNSNTSSLLMSDIHEGLPPGEAGQDLLRGPRRPGAKRLPGDDVDGGDHGGDEGGGPGPLPQSGLCAGGHGKGDQGLLR